MKLLYLCNDPGIDLTGRSGGSIHIRAFVRAFAELGHEVTVLCTRVSSPDLIGTELHAEICPVPLAGWNRRLAETIGAARRLLARPTRGHPDAVRALHNLRFFETAAKVARRIRPDFIYERYSLWGAAGLWLAKERSIPLVLEVNAPLAFEQQRYRTGLACPPLAHWVERQIWQRADQVLAVSEPLRVQLQTSGVKPDRVRVLPNAVDPRLFHSAVDGQPVRQRLKLNSQFVVGFVGTFKRWHGVDLLLAAFREVHQADPATHLLLIGDGPMRPQFEQEVQEAGLQGAVTFAQGVCHEEVPQYLAAMDVAVAPYPALEDFYFSPLKLFEYMAAGRAVVASRTGQVAEVIADGVTGLLYEPGDRSGLVHCIQRIQKDAGLRGELGRRASGAPFVRTWSQNAARVIDWVEPLLSPTRRFAPLATAEDEARRFV